MEKRLQEEGNWLTYIKGFSVGQSLPHRCAVLSRHMTVQCFEYVIVQV
jgi:hypothetical protein